MIKPIDLEDFDYVFTYTWDDAIADGVFADITHIASGVGFHVPMAITSTLLSSVTRDGSDVGNLAELVLKLRNLAEVSQDDKIFFNFQERELLAVCEARSPNNPEPIITIMYVGEH